MKPSIISYSGLASFRRVGAVGVLLASALCAQCAPRNPSGANLRLNLKPKWNASGQVEGIRVTYELAAFYSRPKAPLFLEFDTLQPALRRTLDQVTDLSAADASGPVRSMFLLKKIRAIP